MIPKVIHYCWFGRNPLPESYRVYIDSWKKYCPEYQIIEWNEDNFDISENDYCREAYEAKKWAFVSDYARVKVIYEHGGIYLDTDVEVLKPLDDLLSQGDGFIGFQNVEQATTGLGFAAAPKNPCVKSMLKIYESRHFLKEDGSYDLTPCPVVNTVALKQCGLKTGKKASSSIQKLEGMAVLPICYLNPLNADTLEACVTDDTYTIHHYSASWITEERKKLQRLKRLLPGFLLNMRTRYIARRDVLRMERYIGEQERQPE